MANKIWNGKLLGSIGAMFLVCKIFATKLINRMCSFVYCHNIGECGKNSTIGCDLEYRNPKNISIGNCVVIGNHNRWVPENAEGHLKIGDRVSIIDNVFLDFTGDLTIGDDSHIGSDVYILTHTHGYDYRSEALPKNLTIGKNVFIGSKSSILQNVNCIGDNAIIGACSVVTTDVPDNAIVAGNPARIIKFRSDESIGCR